MTGKDIVKAMENKNPVLYQGSVYTRITEYILWYDQYDERKTSVVLLDRNLKSTVRVLASQIEILEQTEQDSYDTEGDFYEQ